MTRCDVLIAGGAIMGSATAAFLREMAPGLDVVVVEPDPTYELASTVRASGGARRLFSCPENVEMSNFSIPFIRDLGPEAEWQQGGYLFIVPRGSMHILEENHAVQRGLGADVRLMTPDELAVRFPSMRVDDLGGGVHSPGDGWCDPSGFLQLMRKRARSRGAKYLRDRVAGLEVSGGRVRSARLESGATISADAFVNATGAWAAEIAGMAGVGLPISPMRRFEHYFTCATTIEPLPYVKDLDRLAFRPEGVGYSGGLVKGEEPRGFNFEVDHDYFEREVWPALADRFPAMEAVKCHRTWSGLYEQCELDGNPIIGACGLPNFYVLSGFSGHGMMHAPAAGRAIAELIVRGRFETIDLARLGYERVKRGEPYAERGIV